MEKMIIFAPALRNRWQEKSGLWMLRLVIVN
jgi:hypothetical protein